MKKQGVVYLVIGGQNVGKSAWVLERIRKSTRWVYVYDHRREYAERFGTKNITIFYSINSFYKNMRNFKDSNVIIEEGTVFLSSQKDLDMTDIISGCFHNGNIMYFLFHSVIDVPLYILRLSHFCVLFRTGDDKKLVEGQRPLLSPFVHSEKSPKLLQLQEFM